jgi:hypothetical protein
MDNRIVGRASKSTLRYYFDIDMFSHTTRALEDFDNQHDFERMAADILNTLGYSNVEPMAPAGGPDGGRDIKFNEGDSAGIAFATLEKKIESKFEQDLEKQPKGEGGLIAQFCSVSVSPGMKLSFTKKALAKGYRLEVFDLERLRSLLDGRLKDVRRRYLGIDDEVAAQLRSQLNKLLQFPDAVAPAPSPPTVIEGLLVNALPRRVFELLMGYDVQDIAEVPEIGEALRKHLTSYYRFRQNAIRLEDEMLHKIGQSVSVRFPVAWQIYLRYVWMRFGGNSKETIIGWGNFLNYSITWDDAERIFNELSTVQPLSTQIKDLISSYETLIKDLPAPPTRKRSND